MGILQKCFGSISFCFGFLRLQVLQMTCSVACSSWNEGHSSSGRSPKASRRCLNSIVPQWSTCELSGVSFTLHIEQGGLPACCHATLAACIWGSTSSRRVLIWSSIMRRAATASASYAALATSRFPTVKTFSFSNTTYKHLTLNKPYRNYWLLQVRILDLFASIPQQSWFQVCSLVRFA